MSITNLGIQGEKKARELILKKIRPEMLTQIDWLAKIKNKWVSFEVKNKERFKAPPFDGHGLPVKQKNYRIELYNDTGIRCVFLVIEPDTDIIYYQWLDVLEKNKNFFDTKQNIRIYNITEFKRM